jgi:hypothetical protein
MIRLFLLTMLLSSALFAVTPKIYASIGDPVYRSVDAVRTLSGYKTFKTDGKRFFDYVLQAEAAKKEGFWLDTHRHSPETKRRSKAYLELLRRLNLTNKQIEKIVKNTTLTAIKKHHVNTYYAIKKSKHPALKSDAELRRAMSRFERRLAQERKQQQKAKAAEHARYLRSYGNLKGEWRAETASGEKIRFKFIDKKHLRVIHIKGTKTKRLEGRWSSTPGYIRFQVERITNIFADGIPHTRSSSVALDFKIITIGKTKMRLFDTRRKMEIALSR